MKKFALLLLLVVSQAQLWAQKPKIVTTDKPGWHKIGETSVDFKTETDEILVIGANRFKSLKFKVTDAPISLVSMEIFYDKADVQTVKVNQDIKTTGESREIPLEGSTERNVKKVVFRYKTINSTGSDKKAKVELWGLKS